MCGRRLWYSSARTARAALRAANHVWSTPTVGKSIINFFFGSGVPFAIYTAWMLLLVWIWAMMLAGQHRTPQPANLATTSGPRKSS